MSVYITKTAMYLQYAKTKEQKKPIEDIIQTCFANEATITKNTIEGDYENLLAALSMDITLENPISISEDEEHRLYYVLADILIFNDIYNNGAKLYGQSYKHACRNINLDTFDDILDLDIDTNFTLDTTDECEQEYAKSVIKKFYQQMSVDYTKLDILIDFLVKNNIPNTIAQIPLGDFLYNYLHTKNAQYAGKFQNSNNVDIEENTPEYFIYSIYDAMFTETLRQALTQNPKDSYRIYCILNNLNNLKKSITLNISRTNAQWYNGKGSKFNNLFPTLKVNIGKTEFLDTALYNIKTLKQYIQIFYDLKLTD